MRSEPFTLLIDIIDLRIRALRLRAHKAGMEGADKATRGTLVAYILRHELDLCELIGDDLEEDEE